MPGLGAGPRSLAREARVLLDWDRAADRAAIHRLRCALRTEVDSERGFEDGNLGYLLGPGVTDAPRLLSLVACAGSPGRLICQLLQRSGVVCLRYRVHQAHNVPNRNPATPSEVGDFRRSTESGVRQTGRIPVDRTSRSRKSSS